MKRFLFSILLLSLIASTVVFIKERTGPQDSLSAAALSGVDFLGSGGVVPISDPSRFIYPKFIIPSELTQHQFGPGKSFTNDSKGLAATALNNTLSFFGFLNLDEGGAFQSQEALSLSADNRFGLKTLNRINDLNEVANYAFGDVLPLGADTIYFVPKKGETRVFNPSIGEWIPYDPSEGSEGDLILTSDLHDVSDYVEGKFDIVYTVGADGTILKSFNGGESWKDISINPATGALWTTDNLNGVDQVDLVNAITVGNKGNILYTKDGGDNWNSAQTSLPNIDFYGIDLADSGVATAVGAGGTIFRSIDGGVNWIDQSINVSTKTKWTSNDLYGIAQLNSNITYVVGDGGTILLTIDGGVNWSLLQDSNKINWTTRNLREIKMDEQGTVPGRNGSIVGMNGTLLYTSNFGTKWTSVATQVKGTLYGVSQQGPSVARAVGEDGVIVSTDNLWALFTSQTSLTNNTLRAISIAQDTKNPGKDAVSVGEAFTKIFTTDYGKNWKPAQ
ncbi:hypothetical protein COB64_02355 [Candidatus Wolfebacteria bacterium]|nr:MAG: hypothetical protein COB64_02355 [Candidatus Wolfebacteria bacterium]